MLHARHRELVADNSRFSYRNIDGLIIKVFDNLGTTNHLWRVRKDPKGLEKSNEEPETTVK